LNSVGFEPTPEDLKEMMSPGSSAEDQKEEMEGGKSVLTRKPLG
jgi:hypothetical protein